MIELNDQQKNALKDYKFIDLFCGIGGFHLVLNSFGAECVFASEIKKEASKVYKDNFGMEPQGDITKIEASKILEHDILCGGFPCQPFSVSGKGKGFDDPNGKLFFEIIRIAKYHKPQVILLENVANLKKHDNEKSIKTVEDSLKGIGYVVFKQVIGAQDFGVPQVRKRIYIVAFRDDLKIDEFKFPNGKVGEVSLETIIEANPSKGLFINRSFTLIDNISEYEKKCKKSIIRVGKIGQGRQGERIYSIKGCATTLSSQSGGLGGKTGMYLINGKVRRLSGRECARVMGFPDTFKIARTDTLAHTHFGNSVVVNVLQCIIIEVINKITEDKDNG